MVQFVLNRQSGKNRFKSLFFRQFLGDFQAKIYVRFDLGPILEPFREFMLEEHTRNIAKEIEEYKKSQAFDPMNGYSGQKSDQKNKKWPENWPKKWPEKASQILDSMAANPSITIAEMEACLNVGHTTLKKILHEMQSEGIIRRVGPDKGGHWEVVSESH